MSVFESVIGILAPPTCIVCGDEGLSICASCRLSEIIPYGERCFDCGANSPGGRVCEACRKSSPRHVWVSTVYENAAADLIKIYKFGHQRAAAEPIAGIMYETLADFLGASEIKQLEYKIVPMPTATSRARLRGFDHAQLLARKLSAKIGAVFVPALARIGQSRQLGTSRSVRLKQTKGTYRVKSPNLIKGKYVLLVDDVVTTGSSLRAAAKELRAAGAARVDALVFAKRL